MTGYAVCIGTNYVGTPYELAGCLNDANDWRTMLAALGYRVDWLLGAAATKAAMVAVIREVVAKARWGDRIVVTYSGHGTWLPDQSGDEADHRDEAWCPDDMQTAGLLTDDELSAYLASARAGVGILVLPDSCYSGTMTRLLDGNPKRARYLPASQLPKWVAAPLTRGDADIAEGLPLSRTYTDKASLISASAETEVAYDAWFGVPGSERPNGAFTRAAIDSHRPGMSLAAWHNAIRDQLPSDDYQQAPQLLPASLYRRYARAL